MVASVKKLFTHVLPLSTLVQFRNKSLWVRFTIFRWKGKRGSEGMKQF